MEGTALFRSDVPFVMQIEGTMNGEKFSVEGKGSGNGNMGRMSGKWVCTSGKLPMSWAIIAPTLTYGFVCFTKYPSGVVNFCQEAMPDGYSQERLFAFEDGSSLTASHVVTYSNGTVYNKVTMKGEGFKSDSPVITNGVKTGVPTSAIFFDHENGMMGRGQLIFPLKSKAGGYLQCTKTTVIQLLGDKRALRLPEPHFINVHITQDKDADDESDHVLQTEATEAYVLRIL